MPSRTDSALKPVRESLRGHRVGLDLMIVFLLGLAARVGVSFHSRGGPFGIFGYDAGVYYTSAAALIHGRTPYADFVLLHPPALTLAIVPFAALGAITSDPTGFLVGTIAFNAIGALNAVLVVLVARRAGVGRIASLAGGVFYALWLGAVFSELTMRLEPLGNLALLVGLLLLSRADEGRRWAYFAGAAFGVAAVTKIWWVVPVLVIVGWTSASTGGWRRAARILGGAAVSAVVIAAPFFMLAPGAMWRMVVLDQLGRSRSASFEHRLIQIVGLDHVSGLHGHERSGVLLVVAVMAVLILFAAWRVRPLQLVVAVLVAQFLVLMLSPTYFSYYSDYLAAGASLVLAAAATAVTRALWTRVAALGVAACVLSVAGIALVQIGVHKNNKIVAFPGPRLAPTADRFRCVVADSPIALIQLNVDSRDLERGCPNWVDVSGRTYGVDAPVGRHVPRPKNIRWQRDVSTYLTSGQAFIVIRRLTGLSSTTRDYLDRFPVAGRAGKYVLRRVPSRPTN